jgi:hypothetical protein
MTHFLSRWRSSGDSSCAGLSDRTRSSASLPLSVAALPERHALTSAGIASNAFAGTARPAPSSMSCKQCSAALGPVRAWPSYRSLHGHCSEQVRACHLDSIVSAAQGMPSGAVLSVFKTPTYHVRLGPEVLLQAHVAHMQGGLDPGKVRVRNNTTRGSSRRDKATKSKRPDQKEACQSFQNSESQRGFLRFEVPRYERGKDLKSFGISLAVVTWFYCFWIFLEMSFTTRIGACGGSSAIN